MPRFLTSHVNRPDDIGKNHPLCGARPRIGCFGGPAVINCRRCLRMIAREHSDWGQMARRTLRRLRRHARRGA
jgi:hypothetical protein